MTTEQLAQAIYDAHAAPYGEYLTPALAQQLRISARNAALTIHATMKREEVRATPLDPLDRSIRDRHICDLYASGMSMESVAYEVGMTRQGVAAVLRRQAGTRPPARTVRAMPRREDRQAGQGHGHEKARTYKGICYNETRTSKQ